jgi:hypothetical protein
MPMVMSPPQPSFTPPPGLPHNPTFTPAIQPVVPTSVPIEPYLPPSPDDTVVLMDDMPDPGSPNKRQLHPPPPHDPDDLTTQRLAGDPFFRPFKAVRFSEPPVPHDDDTTTNTQPSSSSSSTPSPLLPIQQQSSSSSQPVSQSTQPVSQPQSKKPKSTDDNPQNTPEHFRIDDDDDDDEDKDDDSQGDTTDSDRTVDYGDLVKDLYIDEDEWSWISSDHKICSMTGSFTIPRDAYGLPVDVSKTLTTQRTLKNLKNTCNLSQICSKASKSDILEDYSLLTDDDQAMIHLCFEASGLKLKDTACVVNPKIKKRKEASQTERRQYAKQFAEAKQAEYQSWVDNQVFDLVDVRKLKVKNYVTGRWVLTIKRTKEGEFQKCKARWVLRGFQDRQKDQQQTDSPAATRPGFRLAAQVAANNYWDLFHIDLKTAFLQGEAYDESRDIICELPKEAGLPWYTVARMKKPAYGLNDAPRRWWNIVDQKLRSYRLEPTRADRCCYVLYSDSKHVVSTVQQTSINPSNLDDALSYLLDPVTGSNAKGRKFMVSFVCMLMTSFLQVMNAFTHKCVKD